MEIKLLSSVLHDGTIHARGEILDLDETAALSLTGAGAAVAVAVEEPTTDAGQTGTNGAKTETGAATAGAATEAKDAGASTGTTKTTKAEGK